MVRVDPRVEPLELGLFDAETLGNFAEGVTSDHSIDSSP